MDAFTPMRPDTRTDAGAPDAVAFDAAEDTGLDAGLDAFVAIDTNSSDPPDTFVVMPDAFVLVPDAFVVVPDAFVAVPDAFVPRDAPTGCAAELCDRIDNDCDGEVDEDVCMLGGTSACASHLFGGHVYLVCPRETNWNDARASCMRRGYDLIHINDAAENAALDGWTSPMDQRTWIGLSDIAMEGSFEWVDGAALSFERWAMGEPSSASGMAGRNEDCVEFLPSNARWNDLNCEGAGVVTNFTCEGEIVSR